LGNSVDEIYPNVNWWKVIKCLSPISIDNEVVLVVEYNSQISCCGVSTRLGIQSYNQCYKRSILRKSRRKNYLGILFQADLFQLNLQQWLFLETVRSNNLFLQSKHTSGKSGSMGGLNHTHQKQKSKHLEELQHSLNFEVSFWSAILSAAIVLAILNWVDEPAKTLKLAFIISILAYKFIKLKAIATLRVKTLKIMNQRNQVLVKSKNILCLLFYEKSKPSI
jgi:hypothetical protein